MVDSGVQDRVSTDAMPRSNRRGLIDAPINYVMVYLLFTLVLFLVEYYKSRPNAVLVAAYCLVNFAALFVGWTIRRRPDQSDSGLGYRGGMMWFLRVACLATILVSLNNVFAFYSSLSEAAEYALQPGVAYEYVKYVTRNSMDVAGTSAPSPIGVLLTALTFTKYYVIGISILYWREIRFRERILVGLTAVVYMFQSFAIGAMINVGSLLVASAPFVWFLLSRRPEVQRRQRPRRRGARVRAALLTGAAVASMLYFLGNRGVFLPGSGGQLSLLFSGLLGMVFYLSHGYAGLSYCLELPFVFTWGHTTFRGLATVMLPYLGIANHWADSYLVRSEMAFGWDALRVWSTVFAWLASDLSLWLVPLVFLLVGLSMKRAWTRGITTGNPFALAFVGQLLIFCVMIPANNQLFNTFGNSVATVVIWAAYRLSLRRRTPVHSVSTAVRSSLSGSGASGGTDGLSSV
jgi:hypothetical protein